MKLCALFFPKYCVSKCNVLVSKYYLIFITKYCYRRKSTEINTAEEKLTNVYQSFTDPYTRLGGTQFDKRFCRLCSDQTSYSFDAR
jgi:hypothetical protein